MKKLLGFALITLALSGCQSNLVANSNKKNILKDQPQAEAVIKNSILLPILAAENPNEKTLAIEKPTLNILPEYQNQAIFLPILMFHSITDFVPDKPGEAAYNLTFSPEKFEQFLQFFQEHDITTLTFSDLKNILEGKMALPKKAVILTFDDGRLDNYTNAFRLLKQYKQKGVFFIVTDKPDRNPNYMNWQQLKELVENGQEIGSHTIIHRDLSISSEKQIRFELEQSKKTLEEKTGQLVIVLAYPSGKYNDQAEKIAAEYYLFARTINPGNYFLAPKRHEISTLRIFPTTGLMTLKVLYLGE